MTSSGVTIEHDAANEAAIIRAAIASADVRSSLTRQVTPAQFVSPGYDSIWRALKTMADQALTYTPEAARHLVRQEGADPTLLDLLEPGADVPPNLAWHVDILRWDAARVRIAKDALPKFVELLANPKATPEEVSSAARAIERATSDGGGRSHVRRPGELARQYRSEMAARRAGSAYWPIGFDAMDAKLVEGGAPGKTWVVAGLSGSGKSTWVAALIVALVKLNRKVFFCPWEMGAISILDVIAAHVTALPLEWIVQGRLDDEQTAHVLRVTDFFSRRVRVMENAFFDEMARNRNKGRPDNDRNLDLLEGYLAECGCTVAIYDLWERCLVDDNPGSVARALYRMQAMHKLYSLWGVIIQQLRIKDVERRMDKRPTREGVKGTAAYVEVPDVLIGIHRDAQFKAVPDEWLEAICLKQRKGPANWAVAFNWRADVCGVSGGVEVPYDPGLDAVLGTGEAGDIAGIKTGGGSRKKRPKGRDQS